MGLGTCSTAGTDQSAADIAGLKIGVGPSEIQRDAILSLGGIPTVFEINAVYNALQIRLIDGTDKSTADMIGLKLYQVTKYMTLTNQFSIVGVLMVSRKFMEMLSLEDQAIRYRFPDRKRN